MDAEWIRWALTGLGGIILMFYKQTQTRQEHEIEALKTDLAHLRDTRLHKDDFKEFKLELRGQFEEVKQAIRDIKNV